jgi:hypothetical protein
VAGALVDRGRSGGNAADPIFGCHPEILSVATIR